MNDSGLPSERRISVGIPLSCLLEYPASHDINNLGMPGETCKTTIVDILRSKNTYWSSMKKTLGSRRVRKRQGDWKGPRISRSREGISGSLASESQAGVLHLTPSLSQFLSLLPPANCHGPRRHGRADVLSRCVVWETTILCAIDLSSLRDYPCLASPVNRDRIGQGP